MTTPRPTEATAPAQAAATIAPPDPSEPTALIEAAQPEEAEEADAATQVNPQAAATHLSPQELDELEDILLFLGQRVEGVPSWEFLEGFMAGLLCCRRTIEADEYFAAVIADPASGRFEPHLFQSPEQHQRFMQLWQRRWQQVQAALDAPVEALDDERAYAPELFDLRALLWSLSEADRAKMQAEMAAEEGGDADGMQDVPAFAQLWAIGFMAVVQTWPEEWQPPRDRELAQWMDEALEGIEALTDDDLDPPSLSTQADDDAPSVSQQRLDTYGTALWAAYDLREIARTLGPRVTPQRKTEQPGRNDPCHCGSGKKFKKCHGA